MRDLLRNRAPAAGPALLLPLIALLWPLISAADGADPERTIDFSRPHLLVAGFQTAADTDPRDVWVPDAVENELAQRLRRAPGCITVPTVRAHQSRAALRDPGEDGPQWRTVGRALGATHLLTGKCSGPPHRLRVELRLERLEDDQGAVKTHAPAEDGLLAVLNEATRWVLAEACDGVPDVQTLESLQEPATRSIAALEYTARAARAAREEKPDDALRYAQQAVSSDKRYRPAQALLAQLELRAGALRAASARLRVLASDARAAGDALARARAELAQSLLLHVQGNSVAAATRAETALDIAEKIGDPYGQIAALDTLCDQMLTRPTGGDDAPDRVSDHVRQAAQYQRRLIWILEQLGDRVAMLSAVNKLALLEERQGNLDAALELHERTRALAESLGAKRHEATAWLYIGQCLRRQKRYDAAAAALEKCLGMVQDGARPGVRMILAGTCVEMGTLERGLDQYRAAADELRGTDDLLALLSCLKDMARTQKTLGHVRAAIETLQEAVDLAHVLEMKDEPVLREQLEAWKAELR